MYGQENTEFYLVLTDDNSGFKNVDWIITDKELDDTDNSDSYTGKEATYKPTKKFHSSGSKNIKTVTHFDDGWGNEYTQSKEINPAVTRYDAPILEFTWTPNEPTILDEVTFTQHNNDLRKDDSVYGLIDKVRFDYYNEGDDELDKLKTDEFRHTFTTKQDDIENKLTARYWDGFEYQEVSKVNVVNMSNIPPVCSYDTQEDGVCIPKYVWTATSTDLDDDDSSLSYSWVLYKKDDSGSYAEIDSGTEKGYSYPFQYAGDYKVKLVTSDAEGSSDTKEDEFTIVFDTCGGADNSSGVIRIQPGTTQNIAIPVRNKRVKEYFLDRLADVAGRPASELVKLVKARPASDDSVGKYLIYVPDVTNESSSGNFNLVTTDSAASEINAFLCETLDFGTDPIEFTWDSKDGN